MRMLALLLCCLAAMAQAEVYRSVDKDGNVIFSDRPAPNSKRIYVPPLQTVTTPKPAGSSNSAPPAAGAAPAGSNGAAGAKKPAVVRYKLSIVSPGNDATVRQNNGMLSVTVSVQPPLQQGDLVQFMLNGKPAGKPSSSTTGTLPFVDRGTHSIGAKIVSASGQTKVTASPVTVHLKRAFVTN